MVLSNEPGYYEDGSFGIRIENLVWVSKAETDKEFGDKEYLRFNDLTLVPIQKKLMDAGMLTREEREWVDAYHAQVSRGGGALANAAARSHSLSLSPTHNECAHAHASLSTDAGTYTHAACTF